MVLRIMVQIKTTKYLIEKRTAVTISDYGDLNEETCYVIYKKFLFWWIRIEQDSFLSSSGITSKFSLSFDNPEHAEEYIKTYHANKKRVGRIEIKTEKIIEL